MKTKLIFVRHGYSESNRMGAFTGQANAALTEIGRTQASRAAEYLKDTKIHKIYSSPLSRAFETGLPIAESRAIEIIPDAGLMEINGGEWEEMTFSDIERLYPHTYRNWITDIYSCQCPKGEATKDFAARVVSTVTKIARENPGETVCITTHATPIRVMTCLALNLPLEELKDVPWCPNASINIMEFEDGKFTFVQRDITDHLAGLETTLPKNI